MRRQLNPKGNTTLQSQYWTFGRLVGPDVLRLVEETVHEPGSGQVLLRQSAVGLNFTGNRALQMPWTFVGLPAWSVPGLQVGDLHFGVQIAGHLGDDLRVAGYTAGLATLLAAHST